MDCFIPTILYSSNVYCCVCSTQKGGYSQWHLMNYTTFCTIKSRVVLGIFYQVTLPVVLQLL